MSASLFEFDARILEFSECFLKLSSPNFNQYQRTFFLIRYCTQQTTSNGVIKSLTNHHHPTQTIPSAAGTIPPSSTLAPTPATRRTSPASASPIGFGVRMVIRCNGRQSWAMLVERKRFRPVRLVVRPNMNGKCLVFIVLFLT